MPASRFAMLCARLVLASLPAQAGDWPPPDSGEAAAKIAFSPAWAATLRGVRSFGQLQDAAGAKGRITEIVRDGDSPHAVFRWTGAGNNGQMRALLYEGGDFGAVITLPGQPDIVLNDFDAFICASCAPPVNSCGRRPSWVPHDLHWDVFDCGCTLTAPQSLNSPPCP